MTHSENCSSRKRRHGIAQLLDTTGIFIPVLSEETISSSARTWTFFNELYIKVDEESLIHRDVEDTPPHIPGTYRFSAGHPSAIAAHPQFIRHQCKADLMCRQVRRFLTVSL